MQIIHSFDVCSSFVNAFYVTSYHVGSCYIQFWLTSSVEFIKCCVNQWEELLGNPVIILPISAPLCPKFWTWLTASSQLQYIPRNMHTVFALLCFVVVIHWLIFPYSSGLLHWHCGNLTIAPVPAKQPWWIWINTSCEFIMNDCITTTKQSTTKPCGYFLGYTVHSPVEQRKS